MAGIIAEAHVFHPYVSIDGHERLRVRSIVDIRFGIQDLKDALRGSLSLLDLSKDAGRRTEGTDQDTGKQDKGEKIARCDRAVDDLSASVPQHRGRR